MRSVRAVPERARTKSESVEVRAVATDAFTARTPGRKVSSREDEQPGRRVGIARFADRKRSAVGSKDLGAAWMVEREPRRMRLLQRSLSQAGQHLGDTTRVCGLGEC